MKLMGIIEAVKQIASIFNALLIGLEEMRDKHLLNRVRDEKENRSKAVLKLKEAAKEGDDEKLKEAHRDLNSSS